jgi:hypothetical protein
MVEEFLRRLETLQDRKGQHQIGKLEILGTKLLSESDFWKNIGTF